MTSNGAPGGIVERCTDRQIRPRPTMALPESGPFTFPAPWGTQGVRVTNHQRTGGQDALWFGYAYWPKLNAHRDQPVIRVFVCTDPNRGGTGPSLYEVNKRTLEVTGPIPIFTAASPLYWQTGEAWYWSHTDPAILYAADDARLYRVHVGTGAIDPLADVAALFPGQPYALRQWSTSWDGRTHSATIKDTSSPDAWLSIGTVVIREDTPGVFLRVDRLGVLDEAQVSKSGHWLVIKDNVDGIYGEDNRIFDLRRPGTERLILYERLILDEQGAAGHSDTGWNYLVAADNFNAMPQAWTVWMLNEAKTPQRQLVYHTVSWQAIMHHVSHGNAVQGPPQAQFVVGSGVTVDHYPRSNEILAFRLDGSLEVCSIAPVLTDLTAPGGFHGTKYPMANVDPYGEWVLWHSNLGGAYLDALLVQVPTQHLILPPNGCTHTCPVHCPEHG